ncbi:uncharacterized protein STEHIDRAFT_114585 [Stereum hirsutum FP-91666 SS1]|uniref:uncharacterized protein n=1 Tax=Stereum hirsutum (strain FP-91666) TaxID=721885 RepID=UPI000444A080|nr:uncharacterized protein STEHIDRAFT_114585 [Stereum hirsutum FP-91666 SS1]EIM81895.1 hypothetical protein STEHIDRAFT_114585 [Stereum hirsutum FP-91666 SS1]
MPRYSCAKVTRYQVHAGVNYWQTPCLPTTTMHRVQDIDSERLSVISSSLAPPRYSPVVRNESHRFRAEASPADTQDDPPEEPPSFAASVIRMSLPKPLPPPPQATGENIITNQNDRAPAQNLPLPPPKDTLSWPPPNAWIANRAVNPPWNRPSTPSSTQASQTGTTWRGPEANEVLLHTFIRHFNGFAPFREYLSRPSTVSYLGGSTLFSPGMGETKRRVDRVCIRNNQMRIKQALTRSHSRVDEMQWAWPFEEIRLNWLVETAYEGESQTIECQFNDALIVAAFTRPAPDVVPAKRTEEQPFMLWIFPEGQRCLDHILMSALIIDRMRSA